MKWDMDLRRMGSKRIYRLVKRGADLSCVWNLAGITTCRPNKWGVDLSGLRRGEVYRPAKRGVGLRRHYDMATHCVVYHPMKWDVDLGKLHQHTDLGWVYRPGKRGADFRRSKMQLAKSHEQKGGT